jgi:hypothetical protein
MAKSGQTTRTFIKTAYLIKSDVDVDAERISVSQSCKRE